MCMKKGMLTLGVSALVVMVLGFSPNTHATETLQGTTFDPTFFGLDLPCYRTPVKDELNCHPISAMMATAGMVEISVCRANVRAGFDAPIFSIQASTQEAHFCGPAGGSCTITGLSVIESISYAKTFGMTTDDCWRIDLVSCHTCSVG